mgnify:CR=1 FL=1
MECAQNEEGDADAAGAPELEAVSGAGGLEGSGFLPSVDLRLNTPEVRVQINRDKLGDVGVNFGAGMTGGMAFVYDPTDIFRLKVNPETVAWQRIDHPHWENVMKELVEEHVAETKSPLGARLLNDWDREIEKVWQVVPKEMLSRLPVPLSTAKAKTA